MTIFAREQETLILDNILKNPEPQFVAVYGRRRIGKTFLIRNYFDHAGLYFEITGLKNGSIHDQLNIFSSEFSKLFHDNVKLAAPDSWLAAFEMMTEKLQAAHRQQPCIVFFDEVPWLATKRSKFLEAMDYYWNTKWSKLKNIKIIVCGSAASWMLKNIVNAKGGLHNRLTKTILLKPYNLKQTKIFLEKKKIKLSDKQILDIYMVTGGVPYYLDHIERSKSIAQNINALCFQEDGVLNNEFNIVFQSLFDHSEDHINIIRAIASHRHGITREEIIAKTKLSTGGHLNARIEELIAAGFINRYIPYNKRKKEAYYRVIDEYSLFFLKWIEPHLHSGFPFSSNHWQTIINTPAWNSWAGYSYESICIKHFNEIRTALHLDNISVWPSGWRYVPRKKYLDDGAQIDLLFDRSDHAITLCEIKYSTEKFVFDKSTAKNLANKVDRFKTITKTTKQIFTVLISLSGVKPSLWLDEVVDKVLTLNDLIL